VSEGLKIPVALDATGRVVHAHEGRDRGPFVCPGCRGPVTWRRESSKIERRAHFAHLPDTPCGESALHAAAKMLVAQHYADHHEGRARRPVFDCVCPHCGEAQIVVPAPLCESLAVERPLPGGLIPDVTLGTRDGVVAIEIFHTHAVGADKSAAFRAAGVEWYELEAGPVLEDPARYVVRSSSLPERGACATCSRRLGRSAEDAERRVAEARRLVAAATAEGEGVLKTIAELETRRANTADDVERWRVQAEEARARLDDARRLANDLEPAARALAGEKRSVEALRATVERVVLRLGAALDDECEAHAHNSTSAWLRSYRPTCGVCGGPWLPNAGCILCAKDLPFRDDAAAERAAAYERHRAHLAKLLAEEVELLGRLRALRREVAA